MGAALRSPGVVILPTLGAVMQPTVFVKYFVLCLAAIVELIRLRMNDLELMV